MFTSSMSNKQSFSSARCRCLNGSHTNKVFARRTPTWQTRSSAAMTQRDGSEVARDAAHRPEHSGAATETGPLPNPQLASPLCALPRGPLQHLLLLLADDEEGANEGGATAVRATCRFLRDTFDACNPCLFLGGPEQRRKAETCLFVPTGEAFWAQAPGQRAQLMNLLRGSPKQPQAGGAGEGPPGLKRRLLGLVGASECVTSVTLRSDLLWLTAEDVVVWGGVGLCGRLRRLVLRGRDDLVDLMPVGRCTALRELDLTYCRNLVDLSPLSSCTNLQQLDLWNCRNVSSLEPLGSCTRLEQLHVFNCAVRDLSPLSRCTRLEYLNLWGCRELSDLSPLAGLARLKYLDLGACRSVESVGPLRECTALQHLSLYECAKLRDVSALSALSQLQRLELNGCVEVRDLSPLVECRALELLDIRECRGVSDLGAIAQLPLVSVSW